MKGLKKILGLALVMMIVSLVGYSISWCKGGYSKIVENDITKNVFNHSINEREKEFLGKVL